MPTCAVTCQKSENANASAPSFFEMTEEQKLQIHERIRDVDWCEAFGYAPFLITDVVDVVSAVDGEHDSDSWVGVFLLKDHRFGYVKAGCDYTGWDCQASGEGEVRDQLQDLIIECLEDDDRARLKLPLPTKT